MSSMSKTIRPEILRRICKEPLDKIQSLRLRGRGITRLIGLNACRSLTSLDVSCNGLTGLGEANLGECKELWIVDASNNRLVYLSAFPTPYHWDTVDGLSSSMALGYLNLAGNLISLQELGHLAGAHILEIVLGANQCSSRERKAYLHVLPYVWVLDEEFVTVGERRLAEPLASEQGRGDRRPLAPRNDVTTPESIEDVAVRQSDAAQAVISDRTDDGGWMTGRSAYPPAYRDVHSQGQRTRSFLENVIWKFPCRSSAAEHFRLMYLLAHYDDRVVAANAFARSSTFTSGSSDGVGGAGGVRLDRIPLMPRPHVEKLRALPLELRLDIAVLLSVRAAYRRNVPNQIFAEALMVLLLPQNMGAEIVPRDLDHLPPFVCTALAHILRSSIIDELDEARESGRAGDMTQPLLGAMQLELANALPSVVTGIDDPIERWREDRAEEERVTVLAAPAREPQPESQIEGSDDSESTRRASTLPPHTEDGCSASMRAATIIKGREPVDEHKPAAGASCWRSETRTPHAIKRSFHGRGWTSLCRRAVILMTRSPTCPDLVGRQARPASQRLYAQMEPLLARAQMSYFDLHPSLAQSGVRWTRDAKNAEVHATTHGGYALSTCASRRPEDGLGDASDLIDGSAGPAGPLAFVAEEDSPTESASVNQPRLRSPQAGERVQVLRDTWSVMMTPCPASTSVAVAPFAGVQQPPYNGVPYVDSRDLWYDPRGWWVNASAWTSKTRPQVERLHRLPQGLSASGLPWGAGSLNERVLRSSGHESFVDKERTPFPTTRAANRPQMPALAHDARPPERGAGPCFNATQPHVARATGTAWETSACERRSAACCSHGYIEAAASGRSRSAVEVFSAECAWDPVFVVAPDRLVALQNETSARRKGLARAKRMAWSRIEHPEMYIAPGSMMPRCSLGSPSAEAPTSDRLTTTMSSPGLSPPSLRCGSPFFRFQSSNSFTASHGRSTRTQCSLSRSCSLPSPSLKTLVTNAEAAAAGAPWRELQRQLGSVRASNQFVQTRTQRRGAELGTISTVRRQESTTSWLTRCSSETCQDRIDRASSCLVKTLSRQLTETASSRTGTQESLGVHEAAPVSSSATVFELTEVEHREKLPSTGPLAVEVPTTRDGCPNSKPSGTLTLDPRSAADGPRTAETDHHAQEVHRGVGRVQPRESKTTVASRAAWEPNTLRPADWFPVPARQVLLVDPSFAKSTRTARARDTSATLPYGRPVPIGKAGMNAGDGGDDNKKTSETGNRTRGAGSASNRGVIFADDLVALRDTDKDESGSPSSESHARCSTSRPPIHGHAAPNPGAHTPAESSQALSAGITQGKETPRRRDPANVQKDEKSIARHALRSGARRCATRSHINDSRSVESSCYGPSSVHLGSIGTKSTSEQTSHELLSKKKWVSNDGRARREFCLIHVDGQTALTSRFPGAVREERERMGQSRHSSGARPETVPVISPHTPRAADIGCSHHIVKASMLSGGSRGLQSCIGSSARRAKDVVASRTQEGQERSPRTNTRCAHAASGASEDVRVQGRPAPCSQDSRSITPAKICRRGNRESGFGVSGPPCKDLAVGGKGARSSSAMARLKASRPRKVDKSLITSNDTGFVSLRRKPGQSAELDECVSIKSSGSNSYCGWNSKSACG